MEYGGEYKVSFVGKFGSKGSKAGQFELPYGIAIMDNKIYVADRHNHRIQIFNRNGNYIGGFGSEGSGSRAI